MYVIYHSPIVQLCHISYPMADIIFITTTCEKSYRKNQSELFLHQAACQGHSIISVWVCLPVLLQASLLYFLCGCPMVQPSLSNYSHNYNYSHYVQPHTHYSVSSSLYTTLVQKCTKVCQWPCACQFVTVANENMMLINIQQLTIVCTCYPWQHENSGLFG